MEKELISCFTQVIQQEKNFNLNQKAGTFKINKSSGFFYFKNLNFNKNPYSLNINYNKIFNL